MAGGQQAWQYDWIYTWWLLLSESWEGVVCGITAFVFVFGIPREASWSGPNMQEGRRDWGQQSSAFSQSAVQCVKHVPGYPMRLYLGCCPAFCHLLSFRESQFSGPKLNWSS